MTTRIGKILVFLNLILSLGMATIAVGIYMNRIDWVGTDSSEERQGQYERLREEIDSLRASLARAYGRWQEQVTHLAKLETTRRQRREWYDVRLQELKTGNQPIKQLVYENLMLKTDRNGLPVLVVHPDKRLKAKQSLLQELEARDKEISDEIAAINMLIEEEVRLTFIIEGKPGEKKGLRGLLSELEEAQKRSLAEAEFVKPLRINRGIEVQSLQERQKALRARVEELKKIGVAAGKP
ncbi:MAG: hypothetical protein KatS3mg105_3604 [Gemmatales bacterium]|nr:MAG: hypothetical protein KatS3mg105_3604 [Gemmatales bacterium]